MEKLEDVLNYWDNDSKIDQTQISNEIINIPKLHAKYLRILNDNKLSLLKTKISFDKLKNLKTEYYLGHLDYDTLKKYNWEQFDLKIGNKSNIERYLNADEDLCKLQQKKNYYDIIISTCEQILQELKNRSFQLKSYIDYEKFISGN